MASGMPRSRPGPLREIREAYGLAGLALVLATWCVSGPAEVDLTPGVYWFGGYEAPRLATAGDVDGDGLADFVGLYPSEGGILDFLQTSPLGKPCDNVQARRPFGADAVAVACGDVDETPGAEVLAVLPDGSARVACGLDPATRLYGQDELAVSIPPAMLPKAPLHALLGDVGGDGKADVVLSGGDGRLLLLVNTWGRKEGRRFEPVPVVGRVGPAARVALGLLKGSEREELLWLGKDGCLRRAPIVAGRRGTARLGRSRTIAWATPDDGLAVGRFTGGARDDILIGRRLLPGGDPASGVTIASVPGAIEARHDGTWVAADFSGDGRDDLLRVRRSSERFTGSDVIVHCAFSPGETPAIADSDRDGLRDTWELGLAKPGGLDLPALGCTPDHADVICEIQPMEGVSDERLRSEVGRVRDYFASLTVGNPDGVHGIRFVPVYLEAVPKDHEGKGWAELAGMFHLESRRGVTHWMLVGTGGGGQSGEMADAGSCGQAALFATFVHEFGHQLGLNHSGHWNAAWPPTYPSLMNYCYSYQLGGRGDRIAYSSGNLASMVFDERKLDEYLRAAPSELEFLTGPPYRFRLKPSPDGSGTLIDWNWNGVFGERDLAADINYGYSTYAATRHKLGQARTAAALVSYGDGTDAALLLFAGDLKRDEKGVALPEGGVAPTVSLQPPLRLYLRVWKATDPVTEAEKWSDEVSIESDGLVDDPSACYAAGAVWVAYPLGDGVRVRRVTLDDAGAPAVGDGALVAGTAGARPTLVPWAEGALLLLWRDAATPVGCVDVSFAGGAATFGPERAMPLNSLVPVGAAQAPDGKSLWIGLTEDQDEKRSKRWQVRRLERQPDGTFTEAFREWVGGPDGQSRGEHRVIVLCEPSADFPDGQVYFLQCGLMGGEPPSSCHYIGMRVKDQEVHHGWLVRRYYDEWSTSFSAPGACWFRGDMAYAMRWAAAADSDGSSALHMGFFGRGYDRGEMGDFDDMGFIRNVGLTHSIPFVAYDSAAMAKSPVTSASPD